MDVPRTSRPPMPQSRDYSRTNNRNNHGIIGNGSDNIVNSGSINITQFTNAEGEDELDRLLNGSISKDALHNSFHSPPECHPGTRKTIRNEIGEWFEGSSSAKSPLLWLHGPAGAGKSVIAKTIAGSHDQVVAAFFFSTSSDRSAATLFPTLAWQLAQRIPETKQYIIAALKNDGLLLTSGIKEQFEHLIAQPLKKCRMTSGSLPVMVIDGIDECTDEYALSQFLQVLVRAGESGDMPLRFIVCSRPEFRIRAVLKGTNDHQETEWQTSVPHSLQRRSRLYWQPHIWVRLLLPDIRNRLYIPIIWGFRNPTLLLQEVWKLYRPVPLSGGTGQPSPDIRDDLFDRISPHPVISEIQIGFSEECREDIARYLTDQFNETGHQLGECDISQLVDRSCGQFLYASTIVRLLEDSHPKDILEMARNSSLPTPDLNKLYNVILKRAEDAIRNRAREGGPDYATELRILMDTLAILIVFAENVHFFNVRENFAAIESLISIEKGRLTKKLCKMHSVLNVVPGVSISVYHRSFLEFLQSQKRSGEHYVAYPKALRRFLILLSRAGLRYFVMDWCGQLLDNGRKMRLDVGNLALASRRNYFKRSSSPATLIALHDLIHYCLPFICLMPFCQLVRQLKESFIGAPTSSSVFAFFLEYLFLAFFCFLILSSGSFIISLTIYTLLFNQSLILPLFHPFLHLHFVTMVGILLSSRQASSLERSFSFSQANNLIRQATSLERAFPQANNPPRQASSPERIWPQANDLTRQSSSPERTFSQADKTPNNVPPSAASRRARSSSPVSIRRRSSSINEPWPVPASSIPSAPRNQHHHIPPDGFIPTINADSVISLPPPHELGRPISAGHPSTQGPSTNARARLRDPHSVQRRSSSIKEPRPVPVASIPSAPRNQYHIPPDGFIPTMNTDSVILLPPPHELSRPISAGHPSTQGHARARLRDPHSVQRRSFSIQEPRPVPASSIPSTPRNQYHIPPDGFIPTMDTESIISLPPPHELSRPISAGHPSTQGPSMNARARLRDPHSVQRRPSSIKEPRPVPASSIPSAPRNQDHIPPDGFIPTMNADSVILLPPPYELSRHMSAGHPSTQGSSSTARARSRGARSGKDATQQTASVVVEESTQRPTLLTSTKSRSTTISHFEFVRTPHEHSNNDDVTGQSMLLPELPSSLLHIHQLPSPTNSPAIYHCPLRDEFETEQSTPIDEPIHLVTQQNGDNNIGIDVESALVQPVSLLTLSLASLPQIHISNHLVRLLPASPSCSQPVSYHQVLSL